MTIVIIGIYVDRHVYCQATQRGDRDESEQAAGRPEPRTHPRRGRSALPRARLRRDWRGGSHEGGGPDARGFLWALFLEGGTDRRGVGTRGNEHAGAVERASGARRE